jgi:Leucine-rich repeat (LRR) protein
VAALTGLTRLRELCLEETPVSDLSPLGGLHELRALVLTGTPVTDLAPLRRLKLEVVHLPDANVIRPAEADSFEQSIEILAAESPPRGYSPSAGL